MGKLIDLNKKRIEKELLELVGDGKLSDKNDALFTELKNQAADHRKQRKLQAEMAAHNQKVLRSYRIKKD